MSKFKKKFSLTSLAIVLFSFPLMGHANFETIKLNQSNTTAETTSNISIDNTNTTETGVEVRDWKDYIFTIKHDVSIKGAAKLSDWKTTFFKVKQGVNVELAQESSTVKVDGSSVFILGDNPKTTSLTFNQKGGSIEVADEKSVLAYLKGENANNLNLKNATLKGQTKTLKLEENVTANVTVVDGGSLQVQDSGTFLYDQSSLAKGKASLENKGAVEITKGGSLVKITRKNDFDVANDQALVINKGTITASGSGTEVFQVYEKTTASDNHAESRVINKDSGVLIAKDEAALVKLGANSNFLFDLRGESTLKSTGKNSKTKEYSKIAYGYENTELAVKLQDRAKFIAENGSRGVQIKGKTILDLDGESQAIATGDDSYLVFIDSPASGEVKLKGSSTLEATNKATAVSNKGTLNVEAGENSKLKAKAKGTLLENSNKLTATINGEVKVESGAQFYNQTGLVNGKMPSADITFESGSNISVNSGTLLSMRFDYGTITNKGNIKLEKGSKFLYASQDGGFNTNYLNLLKTLGKNPDEAFININNEGTIDAQSSPLLFLNDNINLAFKNSDTGEIKLSGTDFIKYYGSSNNQNLIIDNAGKIVMTGSNYAKALIESPTASSKLRVYNKGLIGKDFSTSDKYYNADLLDLGDNVVFVNDGVIDGHISSSTVFGNSGELKGNVKLLDTGSLYLKGDKAVVSGNIESKGKFNRLYLEESVAKLTGVNEVNQVVVHGDSTLENSQLTVKGKAEAGTLVTPTDSPFADLNNWSETAKSSSTVGTASTTVKAPADSTLTLKDSTLNIKGSGSKYILAKEIKLEGENLINVDTKGGVTSLAKLLGVESIIGTKANLKSTVFLNWSPIAGKQDYKFKKNEVEQIVASNLLPRYNEIKKNHPAIYNLLQESQDEKELRDNLLATTGYEYGYLLDNLAQRLDEAYDPWIRLNKRMRAVGGRNLTVSVNKSAFNNGLSSVTKVGETYNSEDSSNKDGLSYMRANSNKITIGSHLQSGAKTDHSNTIVDVFSYVSYGKSDYSFETKSYASSKDYEIGAVADLQVTPDLGITVTANAISSSVNLQRYGFKINQESAELEKGFNPSKYHLSGIRGALDYNYRVANTNDWAFYITGGYAHSYLLQSLVTEDTSIPATKSPKDTKDYYLSRRFSDHYYSRKVGLGLEALYEGTLLNHYAKLGFGVRSNYEFGSILDRHTSEMQGFNDFYYHTSAPKYQTRLYTKGRVQVSKNGFVTLSASQDMHNTKFTNRQFNIAYSYRSDALPNTGNFFNKMYTGQENYRGQVYFNTDFDRGTKFAYWDNNGRFNRYNSVASMVYKPTLQVKLNKKTGYTWNYYLKVENRFANSNDYTYQKKLSELKVTTHFAAENWKLKYYYEENYKYDFHDNLSRVSYDYEIPYYIRLGLEHVTFNQYKLNNLVMNKNGDLSPAIDYSQFKKGFDKAYDKHVAYSQRTNIRLGVDHEWEIPFGKIETETFAHIDLNSSNSKDRYYITSEGELNVKHTPSFGTVGYVGKWEGKLSFSKKEDLLKDYFGKIESRLWYQTPAFAEFVTLKLQYDNVVKFYPRAVLDVTNTLSSYLNFDFSNGSDLELFYKNIYSSYAWVYDRETKKDGDTYRNKKLKSLNWQAGFKYTYPVYNRLKLQFSTNISSSDARTQSGYRYENYKGSLTIIYNF